MSGDLSLDSLEHLQAAEIVPDVEAPDLQPTYTYLVPDALRDALRPGACVRVQFGGTEVTGYVLEIRSILREDPLFPRLRPILDVVHNAVTFDELQARLARWVSERYLCDLAAALRCVAPSIMGARVRTVATLAGPASAFEGSRSAAQTAIVQELDRMGGSADIESLRRAAPLSAFHTALSALARKGVVVIRREVARPQVVARTVRGYDLADGLPPAGARVSQAGQRILAVLETLRAEGKTPARQEEILRLATASEAALRTLVRAGHVTQSDIRVRRAATRVQANRTEPPAPTQGQRQAIEILAGLLGDSGDGSRAALLFGVTASGKTEVYLDAIARTLKAGRNAIVLVPEIALTTQVVDVFTGRFGDQVAVLHSRLSEGERHDEWRRLQAGEARIAVGARSAVFAPLPNVGLIVMDEEHEASYKQESVPRYVARDVAAERARMSGALLVLGSATPAVETFHAARRGQIALVRMPERIGSRPLPRVDVVDLRQEIKEHKALLSRPLVEALAERLRHGEQAILFLNRRGYAQFLLCRECGHVPHCPNCAVSLTYHAARAALRCHHCDYVAAVPQVCAQCASRRIRTFGVGTERVEEEVVSRFAGARVLRLDRDTTTRKGSHAEILGRFRRREADILIGTQMVAKGLDFPEVTLVGVISADTSINVPDFRAAERTFQLLTQVSGRAGRGENPGRVIIQTFSPEHYSVEHATRQDYEGFFAREIAFRSELGYPPFSRLVNIVSQDENAQTAEERAERMAEILRRVAPSEADVLGPALAPIPRLRNQERRHVILRAPLSVPISEIVRRALDELPSAERRGLVVDVDPASLM